MIAMVFLVLMFGYPACHYHWVPNNDDILSFSKSVRSIISIFTGMMGTMIGLIFSDRLNAIFLLMTSQKRLWGLKYRIGGAFFSALFYIVYSLTYEAFSTISSLKMQSDFIFLLLINILFVSMIYAVTAIAHLVYQIMKMSLIVLEDQIKNH